MNANEMIPKESIIKAHYGYDGRFGSDNRYQLINWTNVYKLSMEAVTEDGETIRLVKEGSYDELKKIYDLNRKESVYSILSQYRVLGDGSKDTCVVYYKTCGNYVKKGFKFKGGGLNAIPYFIL